MKLTTAEIARIVQGELQGSPDILLEGVAGLFASGEMFNNSQSIDLSSDESVCA